MLGVTGALLDRKAPMTSAAAFLACVVLAAGLMAWRYVGFQGSDDANYLTAALGWLETGFYVGDSHWTLRHPVALPIAAAVGLFGLTEFSVSLPAALHLVGLIATNLFLASRFIGTLPALVGTLLMVTIPGVVVLGTYVTADMVELFYVTLSFWTFLYATEHPDQRWPPAISGALAALGFLTRETSAALVVFIGLVFLCRPQMPRRHYALIAAGFVGVIGAEWLYLTAMTGNPLYRIQIDQHHDIINRAAEVARVAQRGALLDGEGIISVGVWIDPIINLLVTQKYGLLFWVAIPAAVMLLRTGLHGPTRLPVLPLMISFALVWFAFVAFNPKLYLVPRYLVVPAAFMCLVVGAWLVGQWQDGRRALPVAVAIAVGAVNWLGLMVENSNPRFAERALVQVVEAHSGETIYTDSDTGARADSFFRFRGVDGSRVSTDSPAANALVFYNEEAAARCARSFRCTRDFSAYTPQRNWIEIRRIDAPRNIVARAADAIRVTRLLPNDIARKITQPVTPVRLYRVRGVPAER